MDAIRFKHYTYPSTFPAPFQNCFYPIIGRHTLFCLFTDNIFLPFPDTCHDACGIPTLVLQNTWLLKKCGHYEPIFGQCGAQHPSDPHLALEPGFITVACTGATVTPACGRLTMPYFSLLYSRYGMGQEGLLS